MTNGRGGEKNSQTTRAKSYHTHTRDQQPSGLPGPTARTRGCVAISSVEVEMDMGWREKRCSIGDPPLSSQWQYSGGEMDVTRGPRDTSSRKTSPESCGGNGISLYVCARGEDKDVGPGSTTNKRTTTENTNLRERENYRHESIRHHDADLNTSEHLQRTQDKIQIRRGPDRPRS